MSTVGTSVKLTPELRFPDFSGAWMTLPLGGIIAQMQSGLSRKLNNTDIGIPVIRSTNIVNDSIDVSDIAYWYVDDPQGATISSYILEDDDLLVNFINSLSQIGKFAIYKNEAGRDSIFTTNIMRLKFHQSAKSEFVYYTFSTKRYRNFISSITKPAVNQASFTTVDFKRFKVYLPVLAEQKKIADFLSVVDKKIDLLEKKKELLEQYKKGVMQQIFSQKIRFKDKAGNDYPDWTTIKLHEVGDILTGSTPSTKNHKLWSGHIPFITPTDIREDAKYQLTTQRTVFTEDRLLPEGAILYTCIASIGKMAVTTQPSKTNQQINAVIIDGRYNNEFVYYALQYLTPRIKPLFAATTVPIINKTEFSQFTIPIPASKEEQDRVAELLSALDVKMDCIRLKIQAFTKWKKGLLQQMFV